MSTLPTHRIHAESFSTPLHPKTGETAYPLGVPRHLDYPRFSAWGLLERAAALVPERTAVDFMNHQWSYHQIHDASLRLATWLQSRGIQPGDRVAVLLPNSPEYLIALNGIWRASAIAVAISPLAVPEDVEQLLTLTDCHYVVCLDVLAGLLRECHDIHHLLLTSLYDYLPSWKRVGYLATRWHRSGSMHLIRSRQQAWFSEILKMSSPNPRSLAIESPTEPAYILSTGGTTGCPKAVTLSHRNIVANAWQQMTWSGSSMGEERMLAVLPFFHSYGMSTMLASGVAMGATLLMQPRFHAVRALQAIASLRPTVFHTVPAMLSVMNQYLRDHSFDLSSLKWVISGGASLPIEVGREFATHSGALVVEGYGLSEASPVTHVGPLDGSNIAGTIGLPLPDTECRIVDLDEGMLPLADGEVGELIVRGPQVMLGYWNNATATSACIRNGWLYTGDLAMREPNGFYRIVDRKKDLIITSGFNVYPADVEAVLLQHPDIAEAAVVGVPDPVRGETVKAFVVLNKGATWNPLQLERYCKDHLAAHRRPRLWENVQELPRNFLGKVVRRNLRENTTEVSHA